MPLSLSNRTSHTMIWIGIDIRITNSTNVHDKNKTKRIRVVSQLKHVLNYIHCSVYFKVTNLFNKINL